MISRANKTKQTGNCYNVWMLIAVLFLDVILTFILAALRFANKTRK